MAIQDGQLDIDYLRQWQQDYSRFIINSYSPMAQKAIDESFKVLQTQYSSGVQLPSRPFIEQFIAERGGRLIREVSEEQFKAINVLVRQASFSESLSGIPELSKAIRPMIGLTQRQSQAAFHVYEQAKEDGYTEEAARKKQAAYAEKLHRQRAETIAITETAYAFNWGQQAYMKKCIEDGLIGGCQAQWITALDERVCDECGHMDRVITELDDPFTTTYIDRKGRTKTVDGPVVPPMHPRCRCVVNYINVKPPNDWVRDDTGLDEESGGRGPELEEETRENEEETTRTAQQTQQPMTPPVLAKPKQPKQPQTAELDGEIFTVEKKKDYVFSDGKGTHTRRPEKATIYTAPDGTQFIFQDRGRKHQTMTPEFAAIQWHLLPQELRDASQKKIEFVGYYNPNDKYWRKQYKNFTHSYATSGAAITFYRHDRPHDGPYFREAMSHEIGHQIDRTLGNGTYYSLGTEWMAATAADKVLTGKDAVTTYGENSPKEDFAESIMLSQMRLDELKKFPNRYMLLKGLLGKIVKRIGGKLNGDVEKDGRPNPIRGRLFRDILLRQLRERS